MKRYTIAFILLLIFSFSGFNASAGGPGDYAPVIKKQAEEMNDALIKRDYKTYIKYLHPRVLAEMGGEKGAMDTLKKAQAVLAGTGAKIAYIVVNSSSWVVDTLSELQCTVLETIEIKVDGGRYRNDITLIGISKDKGKTWVFIDGTTDTSESIHKQFPELSSKLVIPKPSQGVFVAD